MSKDAERIEMHIDFARKRPSLPEVGKAVACGNPQCPAPNFEVGFGLGGGGYGPYEYCGVCAKIVSKDECDG